MINIEKIIKGLEIHADRSDKTDCNDCSYNKDGFSKGDCIGQLCSDALVLLKKQEPVILENQHKPYGNSLNANAPWISRCPKCGKKVEGKQTRYCKYCGQAVKWDD